MVILIIKILIEVYKWINIDIYLIVWLMIFFQITLKESTLYYFFSQEYS